MILIQSVESDSLYLTELYQWFEAEWDEVEPLASIKKGKIIPIPMVL